VARALSELLSRPVAGRDAAGDATHSTRLLKVGMFVLIGYLVIGRAFSQIGVPSLNIYLGEVALAACFVLPATRATFLSALQGLFAPYRLHVLLWVMVVFLGFGAFQLVHAVFDGQNVLQSLKIFAFNYQVLFVIVGIAFGALYPDSLRTLTRVLPVVNVVYQVIFNVILGRADIHLPFSGAEGATWGMATITVIALMLCFEPRPIRNTRALLLGANVFFLLYQQVRGDWLAVIVAVALWALLTRRLRGLIAFGALGLLLLLVLSAARLDIGAASKRGGDVTLGGMVARAVAPFDSELAHRLSPESAQTFAGTAEWREIWWNNIWKGVNGDQSHQLLGYGYGFKLSDLFPGMTQENVRTPHSVFFFSLGYAGWLGVAVFATLEAAFLAFLWAVYRIDRNPFGLMLLTMALCTGLFGNFFETPYNAIPYYSLIGLALAPVAAELAEAARRAGTPPQHALAGTRPAAT
jgi:hypothetical protein